MGGGLKNRGDSFYYESKEDEPFVTSSISIEEDDHVPLDASANLTATRRMGAFIPHYATLPTGEVAAVKAKSRARPSKKHRDREKRILAAQQAALQQEVLQSMERASANNAPFAQDPASHRSVSPSLRNLSLAPLNAANTFTSEIMSAGGAMGFKRFSDAANVLPKSAPSGHRMMRPLGPDHTSAPPRGGPMSGLDNGPHSYAALGGATSLSLQQTAAAIAIKNRAAELMMMSEVLNEMASLNLQLGALHAQPPRPPAPTHAHAFGPSGAALNGYAPDLMPGLAGLGLGGNNYPVPPTLPSPSIWAHQQPAAPAPPPLDLSDPLLLQMYLNSMRLGQ